MSGMMRNRRLARALADAGFSGFLAKLACKCRWYGAELVEAGRWFPSSRLCSECGHRNDSLPPVGPAVGVPELRGGEREGPERSVEPQTGRV